MGSIHAQFHKVKRKVPEEVRLPFILAHDPGFRIISNLTAEEIATGRFSIVTFHDVATDELVVRKVEHGEMYK